MRAHRPRAHPYTRDVENFWLAFGLTVLAGLSTGIGGLISVVPRHLVASTGVIESLVAKELPFALPVVHVDMLWHERDTRNPSHKWIRGQFAGINYSGVEEAH